MVWSFDFGSKCTKCDRDAVVAINAGETPLCSFHFIEQYDEGCLKALLSQEIDEKGKIDEIKEVQLEIKKQKPEIYKYFEGYFEV